MKLPFDLGSRLIFRLVLPGFLGVLVFWPFWARQRGMVADVFGEIDLGVELPDEVLLSACALLLGLLVNRLDSPIYNGLEGRRWPALLWRPFLRLQEWRLGRLLRKAAEDRHDAVEYHLKAAEYPLDDSGERTALYPTRLGNILAEHETYPDRKYGLDGVFYWYWIWLQCNKEVRTELDEQQAVLDGILYCSAVSWMAAAIYLAAGIAESVAAGAWVAYGLKLALSCAVLAYLFYRAALPGYVQYGAMFKALFDHYWREIDFTPHLALIADETGDSWVRDVSKTEAARIVWRYLRWHRYRHRGAASNVGFETVRRHLPPRQRGKGTPLEENVHDH